MNQIGKRVRRQRERLDMTREEFAESASISPQFLAEIENGKKGMSADTLYKICSRLQLSADYILLGRVNADTYASSKNSLNLLSEPYLSYTEDIIHIVDQLITEVQKEK